MSDVEEHFVLLAEDAKRLSQQHLLTREVGVRVPEGEVRVGIDSAGTKHLLVPVGGDTAVREDTRSRALTLVGKDYGPAASRTRYADLACHDSKLEMVFEKLIQDVLGRIAEKPEQPVPAIHRAVNDWRKLLRPGVGPLSRELVLGLIGELSILRVLVSSGDTEAVASWKGPKGALHDFEWNGYGIEVKATATTDGKTVAISNLDQLDPGSLHVLYLAAVHLRENINGFTVDELIRSILDLGIDELELLSLVAQYGYVYESGVLDEQRFEVRSTRVWPVTMDFPGLRRGRIDASILKGISRVRYDLDLDACPGEINDLDIGRVWQEAVGS